ncbi:MAG: transcription termination factor NusA [Ignavibacteriae bacterium]|nr:transcription termination factor NusA [Ignavibacteriota bacterium]MCB9242531.1 transcription termination factor NusA [Ignavibacteriales bacterium]
MNKSDLIEAFSMMAKEKNIDRDILESVVKDSFRKMMEKKYGPEANFDVIVNMEKGNIEIFLYKTVVEEIVDPNTEIDPAGAKEQSGEDFDVGDDYVEEMPIDDFGRRLVLNLKQNLNQKIREIEKEVTFNQYKDVVGEIIVGEVYQIKPTSILLIHNGNEIIFPKSEQIQKERYRKGDTVRAVIKSVEKRQSGPPLIIASRTDDQFLVKLFELEIPEIYDGIIEIKAIARAPGERAKIAVISNDDRIDAVGACVGMKGMRIHSIVRELSNENIDVINFTDDPALYIARALSPAKLQDIYLDTENKVAKIYADDDQMSLIIGRNGQNIKLASRLTGYQIDVIKEEEDEEEEESDETGDDEVANEAGDESEEEVEETETVEDSAEESDEDAEESEEDESDGDEEEEESDEEAEESDEDDEEENEDESESEDEEDEDEEEEEEESEDGDDEEESVDEEEQKKETSEETE